MKRWVRKLSENHEVPDVDAFLEEIVAVCRKHNMSLAHEDSHGAFLVENLNESNIEWLMNASDERRG